MGFKFYGLWVLIALLAFGCASESPTSSEPSPMDAQTPALDIAVPADSTLQLDATSPMPVMDSGSLSDAQTDQALPMPDMAVDASPAPDGVAPCTPQREVCDGIDNDCDDRIDERVIEGDECSQEEGICTFDGRTECVDGGVVCTIEASPAEVERCRSLAACEDRFQVPYTWPDVAAERPWAGHFEIGQTHLTRVNDGRRAPRLINAREALVVFTPETPLPEGTQVVLRGRRGNQTFGILPMNPPNQPPPILESGLSVERLDPYSTEAYSAVVPWNWLVNGMRLTVAYLETSGDEEIRHRAEHQLTDLGAPHRFTVTRSKIVLFGEPDFPTDTVDVHRLIRDFFPALPVAELRVVDSEPWRLDYIVVRAEDGPVLVRSEEDRRADASDEDHWSILKHQFALRMSLANTGRGLALTGETDGDSSPYSLGTSVAMGWFRDTDGVYRDIDDAPWAAGWTGWTAMWAAECGNAFIHEVGHSFTLEHFTEGTAENWGIADEYPQDGIHLATHPWGYDSLRRQLRSWFRVENGTPVRDGDALVGKRDPMNGGDPPNPITCFPQYIPYQAQRVQEWLQNTPTIIRVRNHLGPHLWNSDERKYLPVEVDPNHQVPTDMDVPVVTLIGTLGNSPEVNQTYPPIFTPSGYTFELPDPVAENLGDSFTGARHFLEIDFEEGRTQRALIAKGPIDDARLYLYSLNLPQSARPVEIRLKRAESAYPELDPERSALLHTRSIGALPDAQAIPVRMARNIVGPTAGRLTERCDQGFNCEQRLMRSTARNGNGPVSFAVDGLMPGASVCSEEGSFAAMEVPVVNEEGAEATVWVHAQREIEGARCRIRVHPTDDAPYCDSADQEQSFRAWIPFEENQALAPGRYRSTPNRVVVHQTLPNGNRRPIFNVDLTIDLEVAASIAVDLSEPWTGPEVATEQSSIYFLVRDPLVGPTERVWWDDDESDYVVLQVPVRRREGGERTVLRVRAQQIECGADRIDFHAGRIAHDCPHQAYLWVDPADNADLVADAVYETLPSAPLIIDAHRWHAPNARARLRSFHLAITYRHAGE